MRGDKMKKWGGFFSLFVLITVLAAGVAEAGTLSLTFKYKNSSGVEQPLNYAYVYLRNAANEPPMEKFFSPADYISGPSTAAGVVTIYNVPEGNYYIRATRRNPLAARPLGPPETGDYMWNQTKPITITAGTTNLGTKYAWIWGSAPIAISGTVKTPAGVPLANRYVRLQTEQCVEGGPDNGPNYCGPEKHIALQRTDASGNYTLFLRAPGTFYIYESQCLGDQHREYEGNPCMGVYAGSVTVKDGDNKTVNIVGY
jgi:hypothetical protein